MSWLFSTTYIAPDQPDYSPPQPRLAKECSVSVPGFFLPDPEQTFFSPDPDRPKIRIRIREKNILDQG